MSVYFARVGHLVKVGYSANAERRFTNLHRSTTRYHYAAEGLDFSDRELLRVIDGDTATEAECHRALAEFECGGEFFTDCPQVRAFIDTAHELSPAPLPAGRVAGQTARSAARSA